MNTQHEKKPLLYPKHPFALQSSALQASTRINISPKSNLKLAKPSYFKQFKPSNNNSSNNRNQIHHQHQLTSLSSSRVIYDKENSLSACLSESVLTEEGNDYPILHKVNKVSPIKFKTTQMLTNGSKVTPPFILLSSDKTIKQQLCDNTILLQAVLPFEPLSDHEVALVNNAYNLGLQQGEYNAHMRKLMRINSREVEVSHDFQSELGERDVLVPIIDDYCYVGSREENNCNCEICESHICLLL